MAATRITLLVAVVASSFLFTLVAGDGCASAGACGSGSCGAGLNPCYNGAGNQLTCCTSACDSCDLKTGNPSTPAPTFTVYAVFNGSDAGATCGNQAAAPGGGSKFADSCVYYTPLVDGNRNVIGSFAANEQVIIEDAACVLTSQTLFFGENSASPTPDTINCLGQAGGQFFQLSIVGGTGKYAGARGYYVSPAPTSQTIGNDVLTYYQKDIYLF